jgi:phosphoglycerol transferase MdoB-like AlkP superfamily enzyme
VKARRLRHLTAAQRIGRAVAWVLTLVGCLGSGGASAAADPPRVAYRLEGHATPARMCPGEAQRVALSLHNCGAVAWAERLGDRVAYHWVAADGTTAVFEGERTHLPEVTPPGHDLEVAARLVAPTIPGRYRLTWTMVRESVRWYPVVASPIDVEIEGGGPAFAAQIEAVQVPTSWGAGETKSVPLVLRNVGCAGWSAAEGDRVTYRWLDEDGVTTVVDEGRRTPVPTLAAGAQAEASLEVRAPPGPGRYRLQLAMVREDLTWFDADNVDAPSPQVDIGPSPFSWAWRRAGPWPELSAGERIEVPLRLDNLGVHPWSPAASDRLSYRVRRPDGTVVVAEGLRTELPRSVAPGASVELSAAVRLPAISGRYRLEWAMVREGVRWFGPPVAEASVDIDVGPARLAWALDASVVPSRMWATRLQDVEVTVRNVGTETWRPELADHLSYRWHGDDGAVVVADGERSHLPGPVAPGESVTVQMRVRGPEQPGRYRFEVQMVREHVRWYGAPQGASARAARVPVAVFRLADALLLSWALATLVMTIALVRWRRTRSRIGAGAARVAAFVWAAGSVYLLAETFVDYAGVEMWDGARVVAASGAVLLALPLLLLPPRFRVVPAVVMVTLVTLLVVADLGYLHFFGSILPLSAIAAVHHLGDARQTVVSLLEPHYGWLVVLPLGTAMVAVAAHRLRPPAARRREHAVVFALALAASTPGAARLLEATWGSLGARVFSEEHNVGRLGIVNAHLFELLRAARAAVRGPEPLTTEQRRDLAEAFAARRHQETADRSAAFGVASGRSVIVLQVEALQQWAVGAKVGGQAVMPFVAGAADSGALVFDHIFDQTAQGRTSDAEYLALASGHPLQDGALSFLRAGNSFRTLAHAAAEHGYRTLSAHPYKRGFWNRAVLHPRYGFASSYFRRELGAGPMVGWGLADEPFLQRMVPRIAEGPQPSFAFLVTLSLHHPYEEFPDAFKELQLGELEGTSLGNYLHAMHYFDRSLRTFFAELKAAGRLDDTVVLIYGDHVSRLGESPQVLQLAGVEQWDPAVALRLRRVPVVLWVPDGVALGLSGHRSIVGGQIDLAPTLAELLGWEAPLPTASGRSLLREGPGFAAMANGSAVGGDRMFSARGREIPAGGGCFEYPRGGARPRAECDALAQHAAAQLRDARLVLDYDLAAGVERP